MTKFNGVSFHDVTSVQQKKCVVCETPFTPRSGVHKFCSDICKGKWKYIIGHVTTGSQYEKISGNWKRYVSRLLYSDGRKRDGLTRDVLLQKLEEQNYLCAISGVELTCSLSVGERFWTNASIDRINAGGPYTSDNIQMVCRGVNSWRSAIPLDEFIEWCRKIVEHNDKKSI